MFVVYVSKSWTANSWLTHGARNLGDSKLVKETPYDAKLTVASSENLELLTGDVFMTDGSATPARQTPYKLVTTDIESVDEAYK